MPGWDCHGLPIENAIEKQFGRSLSRDEMQAKSRAYATEQIALQREGFERLGVLGDWNHRYATMDPKNEAGQIRAFKRVMERGFVYRGLKPVYWCFDCGSSLAEFEIEYADKQSDTLDVAFRCAEPAKLASAFGLGPLDFDAHAVIWTTTAWTLPANQALNLNGALSYALVKTDRGGFIVAQARVDDCLKRWGLEGEVLATCLGKALEGLRFEHPLHDAHEGYRRTAPVYLADYATDADGTGIVHSAPAYGLDDFFSCVSHGMRHDEILNPVQGNGVYAADLPLFGGQHIWKAVPVILDALKSANRLLATSRITHSYPHCWRHKTPVIYRAASQWFVRMDAADAGTQGVFAIDAPKESLRELALKAIEATAFYPENGRSRLRDMIANRPDWCISRQRAWGVPLPLFLHKETGELHPDTPAILDKAAAIVEAGGVEAWSRQSAEDVLGADGANYTKSTDILEVWFDSGSTFEHVLKGSHAGLAHDSGPEADIYLEGHDQHRGWFHSALLLGCALHGRAPYKALLTHGFTVDGQGKKMSKSVGNTLAPQLVADKMGAEIIRLWVAATDYSGDLAIDDKILARVVDAYRRIRNTLRFLLANISDFDPAQDAVADANLFEIDRYALARAAQLQAEILAHYEVYEFHPVVAKLQNFCSEDLGAFYLDVLKDRLYTTAPKSLARRSAQNRAVANHERDASLDGALPVLHRRGGLAADRTAGRQRVRQHLRPDRRGRRGLDQQVDAHPGRPRRGQQGAGNRARSGPDRRLAAGQCDPQRGGRRPCGAGLAGRRPEVRADRLAGRTARRRSAAHRGAAEQRREVRALLALPRGCWPQPCPPRHLRPLRRQPARCWRSQELRLMAAPVPGWWRWLLIAAIVIALDQLTKLAIVQHFQLHEGRFVTSFFNLVRAAQQRRRVQFPGGSRRLAALVLHLAGCSGFGLHRRAAAPPGPGATVVAGAGLDPGRRDRQWH